MWFICGNSQLHLGLKVKGTNDDEKMHPLVPFTCGLNLLFIFNGNVVLSDWITTALE